MPEVLLTDSIVEYVAHFAMILTRCSALFIISPIFGRRNLPNLAKIGLSMFLSFIVMSNLDPSYYPAYTSLGNYMMIIIIEMLVGLVIGFVTTLIFSVTFVAGQVIDVQMGFGMVSIFDPSANVQIPIVGSLLNMMMLLSLLISNGHLTIIQLLMRTFDIVPIGQAVFRPELALLMVELFSTVLMLAINVALPVLAAELLTELALGIIVRTAPSMNVFIVGLPLRIIIGLVMLLILVPMFMQFTGPILDRMYEAFTNAFERMAPA